MRKMMKRKKSKKAMMMSLKMMNKKRMGQRKIIAIQNHKNKTIRYNKLLIIN
jgi:hypothetical protein